MTKFVQPYIQMVL